MERLSRLGFFGGLVFGLVLMGVIWLGVSGAFRLGSNSLGVGYNDIAAIHLQPVPEGPATPGFRPKPRTIDEQPLALLRDLVPDPLPSPSDQPINCSGGGDLIVTLKNGHSITYGPCRLPWQISQLWGAMIETSDLTETNLILPNTAAAAEQEQVRQALAIGIQRDLIRRHVHYYPTMITCAPAPLAVDKSPNGYRCSVVLHSETTAKRLRHLLVCADLSAGRLIHKKTSPGEVCKLR